MSFKILQNRLCLLLELLMEIAHDKSLYQHSGEWLAFHIYQQLLWLQPQSVQQEIHTGLCLVCRPQVTSVHLMTKARYWVTTSRWQWGEISRWSGKKCSWNEFRDFLGTTKSLEQDALTELDFSGCVILTAFQSLQKHLQTNSLNTMQRTSEMTKQSLHLGFL